MITVRILKDKWIPVVVNIPGQRPIRKPMFKELVEYSDEIAKVLISKGYVEPVDQIISEQVEPVPSVETPLTIETKTLTEVAQPEVKVVALAEIETPVPEEIEEKVESKEDSIISYLEATEIEDIAEQVKGIGIATAKKIKALDPLNWEELNKLLNDKQIESLSIFLGL